jgi:predicted O-methyltransferase YrrM
LTGADEAFLRRALRYLASEGVFEEREDDSFALTERSEWLQSDAVGSLRPRAVFVGSSLNWAAWGKFLQTLRTGRSGVEAAFGETLFPYLKGHPEAAGKFSKFMADQTEASVAALLGAYDFAAVREMVDVGGGRGALIAGVLKANAGLRGILFDMPEVIATALPLLEQAGVSDRCEVIGGNFFDAVPAGADLYALKFILHDWSDDRCIRILRNCQEAMAPGGRVLIVEHIVPTERGPHFSKFMDITMLVMTSGGRERTKEDFIQLLNAAGLQLRRSTPTAIDLCVMECMTS